MCKTANLFKKSYCYRICLQARYINHKDESSIKKLYQLISQASTADFNNKPLLTLQNLAANNMEAKYLECELSESQELTEEIASNNILQKISELGVAISIDDFGTGYSSFVRLEQVKIQKLKIIKMTLTKFLFININFPGSHRNTTFGYLNK